MSECPRHQCCEHGARPQARDDVCPVPPLHTPWTHGQNHSPLSLTGRLSTTTSTTLIPLFKKINIDEHCNKEDQKKKKRRVCEGDSSLTPKSRSPNVKKAAKDFTVNTRDSDKGPEGIKEIP
ncbi:hypothetical protein ACOMHN_020267 [Nucella lapillus]